MSDEKECNIAQNVEPYIRVLFFFFMLQPIIIEALQFKTSKDSFMTNVSAVRIYFSQTSRRLGFLSILLNLVPLIMKTAGHDIEKIRVIASMGIVCLWVQLFFWFRLFDSLA